MEVAEIKKLIEETGKAHKEFEHSVKAQMEELRKGFSDPLLKEKIDTMSKSIADMSMDKDNAERTEKLIQERLSKMEADLKVPRINGNAGDEQAQKDADKQYSKAMQGFIRKGKDDPILTGQGDLTPELKALSVGHDPDGGYWVSPEHSAQIIKKVFETSPMRQVCMIETIGSDALDIPEDINDMAGGWSGEVASRSETDTAEIGLRRIPVHELSAMPKASQKILDDAVINVEAWLAGKQADKFSRLENTAFVTGTGAGQPRGFTTYAAGTTNPGQIERLTTATNDVLDDVDLVDVLYKLKAPYRMNATWAFNRATLAVISKIQDGQGRFIFQPGLQMGAPSGLLGRPMVEFNDMADVGNGTLPVAIADWKQAYCVVDRKGVTLLRDPYTSKPHVLFYTVKRTGGDVTNFEAIKMIVIQ
jgi:HK97 family phage major capsid protein